ncbi:MAG: UDP-2,4-diacetamido-2,4,6-trideoxy-beta-L-altropyranose hydrolase [Elusimicrobia bacterium]|nr:UDP-2,4-diacetamido-2,4,6-trideoxy-beta-L-altropyranose hydrolase [Elusimicrobiota bacterium]
MSREIPNFVFFVAASAEVGSGHVSRCRALAQAIGGRADVVFALSGDQGHWKEVLTQSGVKVIAPEAVGGSHWSAVIMDGYDFSVPQYRLLRGATSCFMVMDDQALGNEMADIILNQNAGYTDAEYRGKISDRAHLLLGPSYTLLREEFRLLRDAGVHRDCSRATRVLVSLGGSDTRNLTTIIVQALERLDHAGPLDVTLVLGPHNRHAAQITEACRSAKHRYRIEKNVQRMEQFILEADWAVGLIGVSMWERMCLGLPTLLLALDEHQDRIGRFVHGEKAAFYAGRYDRLFQEEIVSSMAKFIADKDMRATLSINGLNLVDGTGAGRVAKVLMDRSLNSRGVK